MHEFIRNQKSLSFILISKKYFLLKLLISVHVNYSMLLTWNLSIRNTSSDFYEYYIWHYKKLISFIQAFRWIWSIKFVNQHVMKNGSLFCNHFRRIHAEYNIILFNKKNINYWHWQFLYCIIRNIVSFKWKTTLSWFFPYLI